MQLHTTAQGAGALLIFADPVRRTRPARRGIKLCRAAAARRRHGYAAGTRAGIIDFRQPIRRRQDRAADGDRNPRADTGTAPGGVFPGQSLRGRARRKAAAAAARESEYEAIWDLYGGFGALGLAAARAGQPVHVFEISPFAERRWRSSRGYGPYPAQFHRGDLLSHVAARTPRYRPARSDHPRPAPQRRTSQVLDAILASPAQHLAYLSCNPARLGRDLARLQNGGFRPREFQPYDFFPANARPGGVGTPHA